MMVCHLLVKSAQNMMGPILHQDMVVGEYLMDQVCIYCKSEHYQLLMLSLFNFTATGKCLAQLILESKEIDVDLTRFSVLRLNLNKK